MGDGPNEVFNPYDYSDFSVVGDWQDQASKDRAALIARLKAGEQIPSWTYFPASSGIYPGDAEQFFSRPAVAQYNGQEFFENGIQVNNESLGDVFKDVAKLAAIMGTAYLGGTALAGMGGGGTAAGTAAGTAGTGSMTSSLGNMMAASAADAVPYTLMGSIEPAIAASASAGTPSLLSQAGNVLSQGTQWMKDNPLAGRLLMSGATSLLSAAGGKSSGGGGYVDSGYRPTITRGGWSPNVQARQMPTQSVGLLNRPTTGQPMSGLWRYGLLG